MKTSGSRVKKLRASISLISLAGLLPIVIFADEPKTPTTVKELFADFDPLQEPQGDEE
jgi:hypothetical protein